MTDSLRLEVHALAGGRVDGWHELRILVDGRDVVRDAWGGLGRDPDALLGPNSPLIATNRPRHVAVQRCGCGEEGCGSVVARIRGDGDEVVWDDFREGSGDRPSSRKVRLGPFRFAAEQYERELLRAHSDRAWESEDRRTARLVGERLIAERPPLSAPGWMFSFAWAGISIWGPGPTTETGRGVSVSLRNGGRQIVVDFADEGGTPEERVTGIVQTLVHGDPAAWNVSFRGGNLSEWSSTEPDEFGPGAHVGPSWG